MQLTIDSNEPLERVLAVVGSLYGVRLAVSPEVPAPAAKDGAGAARRAAPKARPPRSRAAAVPARPRRGRSSASAGEPDTATLRRWAQDQGHPVKDRGPIPASVVAAYHQRDRAGA